MECSFYSTLSNICIMYLIVDEQQLNINIGLNTNDSEFDRVIIRNDFDFESYEEESECHYFHM
jgi:hypothetical protein